MTSVEQGRHCQKCVKTVHDVTNWSDEKIEQTYYQNNQSMCIRIPEERLSQPKRKTWKYYLTAALATFILIIKKNFSVAQQVVSDTTSVQPVKDTTQKINKIRITGTVIDTLNKEEPLAFANVFVKHKSNIIGGTVTNIEGQFVLDITKELEASDTLELTVEYLGYTPVTRSFTVEEKMNLEVIMSEGHICLKEKVIMLDRKRVLMGAPIISRTMMGVITYTHNGKRGIHNSILTNYDTQTINEEDLQRYNLGR